ncbi:hypothetical protein BHM03_00003056 [Ensete ventricosum]|nr:hypothetical protein BHM03_00003056 [Ensete ventricosum]
MGSTYRSVRYGHTYRSVRLPVYEPPTTGRYRKKSTVGGRLTKKSTVGDRLREKSTVGYRLRKKKGRRRGKEEKKKRRRKNTSRVCCRRPGRPRVVARARGRFFSRARRPSVFLHGEKDRDDLENLGTMPRMRTSRGDDLFTTVFSSSGDEEKREASATSHPREENPWRPLISAGRRK